MLRKLTLAVLLMLACRQHANAYFEFNNQCVLAYKSLLSLKLAEGKQLIEAERARHPQNAITYLLDNYYDFFWLITTDSRTDFDRLNGNKALRLDLINADPDHNSPYYNFAIAQINLQWAFLHSRFGQYTTAGLEVNRAWRALQYNQKNYPDFLPNQMPLSVVQVLLGSLPGGPLKTVLNFLGIKGDAQKGIKMLEAMPAQLTKSAQAYFYPELVYYLTYIQTDVMADRQAYQKMQHYLSLMDSASLLKSYIGGYISLRSGHSTEAINLLQKAPQSKAYPNFAQLDYLLGLAKLNRLDTDAYLYFNRFLQKTNGSNFIKDAWLHLGWQALLAGNPHGYQHAVEQVKTKGNLYNEKDKQAFDEATDDTPNPILLKARLLFDGGFYTKALNLLSNKTEGDFTPARDRLEFCYRLARIYDALTRFDDALKYYQLTISAGKASTYHYAATSAVKMGAIYELQNNPAKAAQSYQQVFSFKNRQFKNSLEQKAREGLARTQK